MSIIGFLHKSNWPQRPHQNALYYIMVLMQDDKWASNVCAWMCVEGNSCKNKGIIYALANILNILFSDNDSRLNLVRKSSCIYYVEAL